MENQSTKFRGVLAALAAVAFSGLLLADPITLTLKSTLTGDFDWTSADSYVSPARAPEAGDTVVMPQTMTATLRASDSASWSLVSSLLRVKPEVGSVLIVDTGSSDATLDCQITFYSDSDGGTLQKIGSGALIFSREPSYNTTGSTSYY